MSIEPSLVSVPSFLRAAGEMAALIRQHDWSGTALGPPKRWAPSLKAMVRMALNTRSPMVILWGPEKICLYNDAYSASLGPEKHPSILGAPGHQAWPEMWHIIGPQVELVAQGHRPTWYENQLIPILRHGEVQDAYWSYSFEPIDEETAPNGIGGVLAVFTETTAQVLAERQTAAERDRVMLLFEQAPSFMVFLKGPDHLFELANPGYMKLVGHQPVLGRSVAEAIPDAMGQGYLQLLDQVYASGEAFTATSKSYVLPARDGIPEIERFVDFVYQPIKDSAGAVTGIFVQGVDVTDRTLAIQALSASKAELLHKEEQLRLATGAGGVGMWDVDLVTDTLFWPASVKAMFGISPDVPVSMADFETGLHPDDRAATLAAFAAAADPAQRSVYDVEYRAVGKEDAVIRWIAAKGRAIFDEHGRCIRVLGTVVDISKRKAAELSLIASDNQLRIALDALKHADRNKDVFLATLGHELRNPLATLSNALTLMERAHENPAMVGRAREVMKRQLDQLVRLTDELLDVSRISLGKLHLQLQVVALSAALEQAAESCMPAIELAGQHMKISLPDSSLVVHGDSARLVQLFGNLISNASKFTPTGGRIEVAARSDGQFVVTSIKDTGFGLAADKLLCIFEPFTQLENSTLRSSTGLGIGLALVKQLVEMHGGTIEARSDGPGHGSEFLLRLPLHDAASLPAD